MHGRDVRFLGYEARLWCRLWRVCIWVDHILYDWRRPLLGGHLVAGCGSDLWVRRTDGETGSVYGVRISMWSVGIERHVDACGQLKTRSMHQ